MEAVANDFENLIIAGSWLAESGLFAAKLSSCLGQVVKSDCAPFSPLS